MTLYAQGLDYWRQQTLIHQSKLLEAELTAISSVTAIMPTTSRGRTREAPILAHAHMIWSCSKRRNTSSWSRCQITTSIHSCMPCQHLRRCRGRVHLAVLPGYAVLRTHRNRLALRLLMHGRLPPGDRRRVGRRASIRDKTYLRKTPGSSHQSSCEHCPVPVPRLWSRTSAPDPQ